MPISVGKKTFSEGRVKKLYMKKVPRVRKNTCIFDLKVAQASYQGHFSATGKISKFPGQNACKYAPISFKIILFFLGKGDFLSRGSKYNIICHLVGISLKSALKI